MTGFKRRPARGGHSRAVFDARRSPSRRRSPTRPCPKSRCRREAERADGPVDGYRATRSATATKTDTPLKEVPASVTVVPAQLMKDQAMQSMGDVFRYVPGVLMHQGEGNRDQIVIRGISTTADFLRRRHPRRRAGVPRPLQPRARRSAEGPGRHDLRPRRRRWRRQPRHQEAGVRPRRRSEPHARQLEPARGTVDLGSKLSDSAAWRLNAMDENSDSFRNGVDLERYAVNPTLTVALSRADRAHARLRAPATTDRRPRYSLVQRRAIQHRSRAPSSATPTRATAQSYVDGVYAILDHDFGGGVQLKNTFRAHALRQVLPERLSRAAPSTPPAI